MTLGDAEYILRHLNEPSFIENIRDSDVRTLDDARGYLTTGPLASYEKHGFGLMLVEDRRSGEPMGMCGLLQREYLEHPDVGFALDPPYWNRGYATEAADAVIRRGFSDLGCEEILGITSPGNGASIKVLRRVGMTLRGRLEERDLLVFGVKR